MSENHKKAWRTLNYFKHFLIFVSATDDSAWVSAFVSLFDVPVGTVSSAVELKIWAITAGIKKYKSIIKKKRKKHDKIVFLAKTKLSTVNLLITKVLNNSYINHDEFPSVNNLLREHQEMKEKIKNSENAWKNKTLVTSSNPRNTSSNPQVRKRKPRVARLKAQVRRLKPWVEAIKLPFK